MALRADYEEDSETKIEFHTEALQNLKAFLAESERRKRVAKKRLAETQQILSAEETERLNKIYTIVENIGKLLAKSEKLGAEGKVEETLKVMKAIEKLDQQKNEAEEEYRNSLPASFIQQQRLRVCEVCSSYLGLRENDERLVDHFKGKLHMGFLKLYEKAKELEEIIQEKHIKEILDKEFEVPKSECEENKPKFENTAVKCSPSQHHTLEHHSKSSKYNSRPSHTQKYRHNVSRHQRKGNGTSESYSSHVKKTCSSTINRKSDLQFKMEMKFVHSHTSKNNRSSESLLDNVNCIPISLSSALHKQK